MYVVVEKMVGSVTFPIYVSVSNFFKTYQKLRLQILLVSGNIRSVTDQMVKKGKQILRLSKVLQM